MSDTTHIPTLDDVARVAGVSTATVSRCLNEQQKVSAKTLERVMKTINDLGYTPNFNARAMAAKRTHTIGAIIPTMENAIFARGLQAFQETLHASGYNLLVSSSAYQPDLEAEQIRALVARGADGLLLIGYERGQDIYDYLQRRGVPTVLAWTSHPDGGHASVGFDNCAAMRMLADRVLAMGHRRIAVISGIVEGNDRAEGRLRGIRESLVAHGQDPDALPVIQTAYEIENGAAAFETLMAQDPRPTVVMCGNDVLAAGAISRAKHLGLAVPEDVSITGFDDIELASILHPTLTTVHVPHRDMGCIAAQELIDMVEKRSMGATRKLEVSLAMRESLRPVVEP
ncbi:LacI family DNA-binding transcriptional regulator [Sulfitobacter aestuariivivens]|uniref:LacI family DNA-binding transcriptional regulator n=1 Tax=Sulfitobacter aestuariivivens TaxID=2766981 RepID=A0A927HEM0_9RHOB|nr:LacI family DNA-binding transcriptional regulator [Sulfitobacter aestuariivivens]MBD3662350.1 LacI family DNA-binding transcriptional regulator [Sulfitobacter aestuariivivens]